MDRKNKNIITRLQDFLETKTGQTILNFLYSWGAAIVILGALFKLTHIKGADLMLFIGMGTEVIVFIISGFDRQASTLGNGAEVEGSGTAGGPIVIGGGAPLVAGAVADAGVAAAPADIPVIKTDGQPIDAEALAAMANLAAANAAAAAANAANGPIIIGGTAGQPVSGTAGEQVDAEGQPSAGPAVIGEAPTIIGHGGTVDIPEMEKVTTEYVERLREISESFIHVAEQAEKLENCSDEMERLSRNLTSINTIYELHLKSLGGQINNIDSVNAQTQRMADQIEELNAVYKRMLESMTVNMGGRNTNPDSNS